MRVIIAFAILTTLTGCGMTLPVDYTKPSEESPPIKGLEPLPVSLDDSLANLKESYYYNMNQNTFVADVGSLLQEKFTGGDARLEYEHSDLLCEMRDVMVFGTTLSVDYKLYATLHHDGRRKGVSGYGHYSNFNILKAIQVATEKAVFDLYFNARNAVEE